MIRTIGLLCAGSICCGSVVLAGSKTSSSDPFRDVAVVLRQEADAPREMSDRRDELAAARESGSAAAAWWQSGYVQRDGGWEAWETSQIRDPELLSQYRLRRAEASASASSQLKLANWCRDVGLADQERAHLLLALRTGSAPQPEAILRRLGYRQIGWQWMNDGQLSAAAEEAARLQQEWKRLQPRLESLASRLEGAPRVRLKAFETLQGLTNPANIPVLEFSLGHRSEATGRALVDVLAGIDSYRASQSLARLAITSPWESVRVSATDQLKQRPLEDFVPMTLALMHQPIEQNLQVNQMTRQREWRYLFTREGRETIEVAALCIFGPEISRSMNPTTTSPFAMPFRFFEESLHRQIGTLDAERNAMDTYQRWLVSTDAVNDMSEQVNQRAGAVLSAVTSVQDASSPKEWWDWWDQAIGIVALAPKSTLVVDVEVINQEPQITQRKAQLDSLLPRLPGSCLVAGTPVWTEEGFRPIETIQIGDRVLSKNTETGELRYQPVLQTTRRSGATMYHIQVGDETISASLGHNFWISGRGWTRTNQLENGMSAHTPTGTVRLEVEPLDETADVFNLVVADFHTYFVGKAMLLGHDALVPSPSDFRVPGLQPEFAELK